MGHALFFSLWFILPCLGAWYAHLLSNLYLIWLCLYLSVGVCFAMNARISMHSQNMTCSEFKSSLPQQFNLNVLSFLQQLDAFGLVQSWLQSIRVHLIFRRLSQLSSSKDTIALGREDSIGCDSWGWPWAPANSVDPRGKTVMEVILLSRYSHLQRFASARWNASKLSLAYHGTWWMTYLSASFSRRWDYGETVLIREILVAISRLLRPGLSHVNLGLNFITERRPHQATQIHKECL